jgi:DNA-binding SARP family transcriptional activator/VIT1/CCC1 family predicted Fe2+/Mn2+ transporter
LPWPAQLEVVAHSLTAVLGVWLGLTVLTRSRTPNGVLFAALTLATASWSSAIVVERMSDVATVVRVGNAAEELAGGLATALLAHLALAISTEGQPSRRQRQLIASLYVLNVALSLPAILDPGHPIRMAAPNFSFGPVPALAFYAGWAVVRFGTFLAALAWVLQALRRPGLDAERRRALRALLAMVAASAIGGGMRILPVIGQSDPWIGVSFFTLAMIFAAYVVFSAGVFFASDVVGRAFRETVVLGLAAFGLVAVVVVIDESSRVVLGIDAPVLTGLSLVIVIALYEPVTRWVRGLVADRSHQGSTRRDLLQAVGQPQLTAQSADAGVRPALARLTRALDLTGASVVATDGRVLAAEGRGAAERPTTGSTPAIQLMAEDELVGELRIAGTRSGRPLPLRDAELLRLSAHYVASALRAGRIEDEQVEALRSLAAERTSLDSTASILHAALVRRSSAAPGLEVRALGPLRVDREGGEILRWGGEKAGTRQAQALFAFLFDRGERGVAKDEALELIWPDTDLARGDLAFHRTLGGLRHTLDPNGGGRDIVRHQNDRYRLDSSIIDWSDVAAFTTRLDEAGRTSDPSAALALLQDARTLYRGDFLDDCPFYGDSAFVETRRAALRSRYVDLLVAIGEASEQRGDRVSAAAVYRDAIEAAPTSCAPAEAGLARIGLSA